MVFGLSLLFLYKKFDSIHVSVYECSGLRNVSMYFYTFKHGHC